MLDKLIQMDIDLFLFLNGIHSESWDKIMCFVSGKLSWAPLYAVFLFFIIRNYKWHSITIILLIVLTITLADQISVKAFKFVFERLRPCHNPNISHLVHIVNNKCGGQFGFVSSHASNSFAVAMFLHLLFKTRWFSWFIFAWAALVSYSRVYLGVHYPADITGGAILGMIIGFGVYQLYPIIQRKLHATSTMKKTR